MAIKFPDDEKGGERKEDNGETKTWAERISDQARAKDDSEIIR
jgi:hypothetical protein